MISDSFPYINSSEFSPFFKCEECKLPVFNGNYYSCCMVLKCSICTLTPHVCMDSGSLWFSTIGETSNFEKNKRKIIKVDNMKIIKNKKRKIITTDEILMN